MLSPIGVANIFRPQSGSPWHSSHIFVTKWGNLYPDRGGGGGGERAILGYVCKNGPVQEDINPSIYIINLTPLVYKNLTFYSSDLLCSLNLSSPKTES